MDSDLWIMIVGNIFSSNFAVFFKCSLVMCHLYKQKTITITTEHKKKRIRVFDRVSAVERPV
jgi:hypothetical protein